MLTKQIFGNKQKNEFASVLFFGLTVRDSKIRLARAMGGSIFDLTFCKWKMSVFIIFQDDNQHDGGVGKSAISRHRLRLSLLFLSLKFQVSPPSSPSERLRSSSNKTNVAND